MQTRIFFTNQNIEFIIILNVNIKPHTISNTLMCMSVADGPTEMVATWVTDDPTDVSIVEYGLDDLNLVSKGIEDTFTDGGSMKRVLYMHRVKMTGLVPGREYSE